MDKQPQAPWELAKSLDQTICTRLFGPMYGVYYPWRKTADFYVALDGSPIHCCQCDEGIPVDDSLTTWRQHIRTHARRTLVNPILFIGRDNEGKVYVSQERIDP